MRNPICGKKFVITGLLERYERLEALSIIQKLGGTTSDNPVNTMDYLVLGHQVWSELNNGIASRKVQKAAELQKKRRTLKIISEDDFYTLIDPLLFLLDELDLPKPRRDKRPFYQELLSSKIPYVGESTALLLEKYFVSMNELKEASIETLSCLPGLGCEKSIAIYEWLQTSKQQIPSVL